MKLKLPKLMRYGLLGVLCLGLVILSFLGIRNAQSSEYVDEEITLLEYNLIPEVDYKVNLKTNRIYYGESLGKSQVYPTELAESIFAEGRFLLEQADTSEFDGHLITYAHVLSYYGESDLPLWEYYIPFEKKPVMLTGTGELSADQTLKLDRVFKWLYRATEDTGLEPYSEMRLVFKLIGEVSENGRSLPLESKVIVQGPAFGAVFDLIDTGQEPVGDRLTKTQKILVESGTLLNAYIISAGILLVFAILLFFLTSNKEKKSEFTETVDRIFAEYTDRLVKLDEAMPNRFMNFIHMNTIKDMVKIADEIRQPIFYHGVDDEEDQHMEFYVFNENRVYYLAHYGESKSTLDNFIVDLDRDIEVG